MNKEIITFNGIEIGLSKNRILMVDLGIDKK